MAQITLQNVMFVTGKKADIIIENKIIKEITEAKTAMSGQVIDCTGMFISSGWIDLHVHAFSKHEPYGDCIDEIGYKQGVTTIVDAGSCGENQIAELVGDAHQAKTNVFAFLNISEIGLKRVDELAKLSWINQQKVAEAFTTYPQFIVGLKARMSRSVIGENGVAPLKKARQIADDHSLPLMVHIGSSPPLLEDILPYLKKNDIITHYLHGKENGWLDENGIPKEELLQSIQEGVRLDVGHGSASFSFQVAALAKKHHIHFDTISTDIYRENRLHGPVYSLAETLTKFLSLGYPLPELIQAVTKRPAQLIQKPEIGEIKRNALANLTLFSLADEPVTLEDSMGETRTFPKKIIVEGVVVNGEYFSTKASFKTRH